jgi:CDP-diacylglycerol--serine O-phosphatidyltransferase
VVAGIKRRMDVPPLDRSRDRRIEDLSNRYVVHPLAHRLLRFALAWRIPANAVSVGGLAIGAGGAACFYAWSDAGLASLGFLLCLGWLVADGLDGMVARATGTTSALGRMLDGLCDHGVFILIYVALATSIGTAAGWALAFGAGAAHALQSNLYEAERARFHRRLGGNFASRLPPARFGLLRLYDGVAGGIDRLAAPFDQALARASETEAAAREHGRRYARAVVPPMRIMTLLSANVRVVAIYIACLCDDPKSFWWFEIGPLSIIAGIAIVWLRRTEARLGKH